MHSTSSKRVSFSEKSEVIFFPRIQKKEKSKFWTLSPEVALSKVMWARAIQQLQAIDKNQSNYTDASDYMGLEKYLSMEHAEHREQFCKQYIKSVIRRQFTSSADELAAFAQSQSRDNVARSHKIAVFYASRQFQGPKRIIPKDNQRRCIESRTKSRGAVMYRKINCKDTIPKMICCRSRNEQVLAATCA